MVRPINKIMQLPEVRAIIQELSEQKNFYDYKDAEGYIRSVHEEILEIAIRQYKEDDRPLLLSQARQNLINQLNQEGAN